jgi:acetyltransferase-like isoleucine patch superfamily enzyme
VLHLPLIRSLYSKWVQMTYPFEAGGIGLQIDPASSLPRSHAHRIRLGRGLIIQKDGAIHVRAPLDESGQPAVVIGDNCTVGAGSTISAKNLICLESNVILGSRVLLQDHAHAYEDIEIPIKYQGVTPGGRIRLGPGCRIGDGAVILCYKGELVLGPNCVVQPMAVLTRSFPEGSIIGGNPARIVSRSESIS